MTAGEVRERLEQLADKDYKAFNDGLVPGAKNTLGVRLPCLRALAKEIAREDWERWLWESLAVYYEEVMLRGMVIGYGRMETEKRFLWLDQFVPMIDNWAVCDSCCTTYRFMKQEQEKSLAWLKKWKDSSREFEVRFLLVSLLSHFVNDAYVDLVLETCNDMKHEGYYARMAAAWAVSVCFVKYPEKALEFLRRDSMDVFTHNKAIQKICESFRVPGEMKEEIRKLKRKG